MTQQGIEMILMRRLASLLTMPILLVSSEGDLVFFNWAAAPLLGRPFESTGPITRGDWSALFSPTHPDGSAMKREEQPLYVATVRREPCHRRGWVRGLDGIAHDMEGIAFPLIGQGERMHGAVGVFWDPSSPPLPGIPRPSRSLDLASPGGDRPVELLLMRQLASYLTTAFILVGPDESLIFFNEPAERLIGRRFEEAEAMDLEEWSARLDAADEHGQPIAPDERPMVVAQRSQRPVHRRYSIRAFDGARQPIEGLAFPLVGERSRQLGSVGIFWEVAES